MKMREQTKARQDDLLKALAELANAKDSEDMGRLVKRWPDFLPTQDLLQSQPEEWLKGDVESVLKFNVALRDKIRNIWRRGPEAEIELTLLLVSVFRGIVEPVIFSLDWENPPIRADLARRRLSYIPQGQFGHACYLLLENADKVKVCANPECPAPYFIARKAIQRYCSPDCLKLAQRQWSLDWYNRVGKNLRKGQRKQAKSNPKKGR